MKLKDGLLLRQVAGQYVIVPTGERVREVTGVHYLTPGAAWLWGQMEGKEFEEKDLVDLAEEHFTEVARQKLEEDIHTLLKNMGDNNLLDDRKIRGQATVRISKEMYEKLKKKFQSNDSITKEEDK